MTWANVYNKCGYQYVKIGDHKTLDEALDCVNEYGVYKYVGTVQIENKKQPTELTREKMNKIFALVQKTN